MAFYGDKGTLELDGDGSFIVYDEADKEVDTYKSASLGDQEHIANFIAAIRNGKPETLNSEIAEGHKSTLLCHLGNIAQRTGHAS